MPLYEPWRGGRYDVRPNLHALGRDFGNGPFDHHVFQFAADAPAVLRAKRDATTLDPASASLRSNFDAPTRHAASELIRRHLPAFDASQPSPPPSRERGERGNGPGEDLHDLAARVPEDLAVVRLDRATGRDWVAALEVCHPAGWSPRDKIGQSFAALHAPVAGGEALRTKATHYVHAMCAATGGLVRFGWGLQFDADLDNTPGRPRADFDPAAPRVLARVERQTIHGLCGGTAALFTIRTYLYDVADLSADSRRDLAAAVASMSPAARLYKAMPRDTRSLRCYINPR